MKCYVSQDFAADGSVQEALELIEKHHGRIIDFTARGPAGGNPCIMVAFDDRTNALSFLKECSPEGEDENWLKSRIDNLLK